MLCPRDTPSSHPEVLFTSLGLMTAHACAFVAAMPALALAVDEPAAASRALTAQLPRLVSALGAQGVSNVPSHAEIFPVASQIAGDVMQTLKLLRFCR